MGLVQRYPGVRLNNQAARRISFAFGASALEKVLVYGVNGGREIVSLLGLGFVPTPSTYRLLVWRDSAASHVRGFWQNLEVFLRHVYGNALPAVTDAIAEIASVSFGDLTGCDPDLLQIDAGDLAGAGCSEAYRDAAALFPFNQPCSEPEVKFRGGFRTTCLQEQNLLSRPTLSALELRAFLYNCNGFNSLFTGYGYTAEEYDGPLVREFWFDNVPEVSLAGIQAMDFHVLTP